MTEIENQKTGYIYILFNEMYKFYGDDVYKLGKTNNIAKRLHGYVPSYIKHPEVKYLSKKVINYSLAEKMVFEKLKAFRIAKNREFFKITNLTETIIIIDDIIDNINNMDDDELITAYENIKNVSEANKQNEDMKITDDELLNLWNNTR